MASPWKFLTRLVSPRRRQKRDESAIEDVKPDVLAIAGPTEITVEESLHIADQPAGGQPPPVDRSLEASAKPEQSDETRTDVQDIAEGDNPKIKTTSGPVSPDIGVSPAHAASEVEETAAGAPAKQRTRAKKVEAVAVVSQTSPAPPSVSREIVSLDEEITVLRAQLASKLRLQNAQLKKMLERFER